MKDASATYSPSVPKTRPVVSTTVPSGRVGRVEVVTDRVAHVLLRIGRTGEARWRAGPPAAPQLRSHERLDPLDQQDGLLAGEETALDDRRVDRVGGAESHPSRRAWFHVERDDARPVPRGRGVDQGRRWRSRSRARSSRSPPSRTHGPRRGPLLRTSTSVSAWSSGADPERVRPAVVEQALADQERLDDRYAEPAAPVRADAGAGEDRGREVRACGPEQDDLRLDTAAVPGDDTRCGSGRGRPGRQASRRRSTGSAGRGRDRGRRTLRLAASIDDVRREQRDADRRAGVVRIEAGSRRPRRRRGRRRGSVRADPCSTVPSRLEAARSSGAAARGTTELAHSS